MHDRTFHCNSMPCLSCNIVVIHVVILYDTHIIVQIWLCCIKETQKSPFHVLTCIELGPSFLWNGWMWKKNWRFSNFSPFVSLWWIVKNIPSHLILYKCFLTYQMHDGIFMGVIHYNFLGQNLNNKSCILGLTKRSSNDLHINESNDAIKPSNSKLCVHSFIIKMIIQPITN